MRDPEKNVRSAEKPRKIFHARFRAVFRARFRARFREPFREGFRPQILPQKKAPLLAAQTPSPLEPSSARPLVAGVQYPRTASWSQSSRVARLQQPELETLSMGHETH